MTTSQRMSFLSEVVSGAPIPVNKRAYFQARLRNRLYDFVVTKFLERERNKELTRAELARRIGRKPESITRLLGAPGNWTLGTVSDLLLGINGEELEPASLSLLDRPSRNFAREDWIKEDSSNAKEKVQQSIDALLEEMKMIPDVKSRVVMLVNWTAAQLDGIARLNDLGGGNEKIKALASELRLRSSAFADAVVANTPYANQKPSGSTPSG
jgi:hypothetical protein